MNLGFLRVPLKISQASKSTTAFIDVSGVAFRGFGGSVSLPGIGRWIRREIYPAVIGVLEGDG